MLSDKGSALVHVLKKYAGDGNCDRGDKEKVEWGFKNGVFSQM